MPYACKKKQREYQRKWRKRNPDNRTFSQKWTGERAREYYRKYYKKWAADNRDKIREYGRRHRNLPEPTRPEPEVCECCGGGPGNRAFSLDHCHDTGDFRGWLCGNCNSGIGMLGDSIEGVARALEYLKRAYKET